MHKNALVFLFSFCTFFLNAQEPPKIKFGKIAVTDFVVQSPVVDSNTNAVILSDIGSTEFEAA
jgi:hypothetical protein